MRRLASLGYGFCHAVLLGNAGRIAISSGLNAVLGFAFWWLAVRLFVPAAVGTQSAVIAVMNFVGLFGEAGFGTFLLGEIQLMGANASPLIIAGSLAGASATLLLAVPTALVMAAATGDLIAFIDDDAVADASWFDLPVAQCKGPDILAASGWIDPLRAGLRPAWLPEEFLGETNSSFATVKFARHWAIAKPMLRVRMAQ